MSCGVGHRCGLDLVLWLWRRPVAIAPIGPLAWVPPYATGAALKRQKKKKKLAPESDINHFCSYFIGQGSHMATTNLRGVRRSNTIVRDFLRCGFSDIHHHSDMVEVMHMRSEARSPKATQPDSFAMHFLQKLLSGCSLRIINRALISPH